MRKQNFISLFLLLALIGGTVVTAAASGTARAQEERIAAIVNDDIVSAYDIAQREALVITSAQLPDNDATRRRIRPEVVRSLINEALQLQEARKMGIKVSDEELALAVDDLERRNKMAKGQIFEILARAGIDKETLLRQLRAEIAWGKVVRRRFSARAQVSEDEIDQKLAEIKARAGKDEYLIDEIFLPYDRAATQAETVASAKRLISELRQGASFAELARQFSQGLSAKQGGSIGWILPEQLAPELARAIRGAEIGAIKGPVVTPSGVYILKIRDRRKILGKDLSKSKVKLSQVVLPLPENPSKEDIRSQLALAREIRASLATCEDIDKIAGKMGDKDSGSVGTLIIGQLPAEIRRVVINMKAGDVSKPILSKTDVRLLMVCERTDPKAAPLPTREQIRTRLIGTKLARMAQRYLRDLRRDAVIEFR